MAMSTAQPIWLQDLQDSYHSCPQAKKLLASLAVNAVQDQFKLQQGVIKYKDRIWLGHCEMLQQKVIHALHASPIGGHSGLMVTYTRIKKLFSWPQMKRYIQEFVASCTICQQAKTKRVPYTGLP
jgi:hypothetical protein